MVAGRERNGIIRYVMDNRRSLRRLRFFLLLRNCIVRTSGLRRGPLGRRHIGRRGDLRDGSLIGRSPVDGRVSRDVVQARDLDAGGLRLARYAAHGDDRAVRRRELPALVVVRVVLRHPLRDGRPARRRKAQVRPRLLARLDAGADQDLQRLCLLERIDRVVADPDEFEARVLSNKSGYVCS
jgi:hypothetical protein